MSSTNPIMSGLCQVALLSLESIFYIGFLPVAFKGPLQSKIYYVAVKAT